jgi:hypothetical protein
VHRDLGGLQYEMNFSAKLQRSYLHYTTYWLSGAAAVGMLMALLPLREKKIYTMAQSNEKTKSKLAESGFALGALHRREPDPARDSRIREEPTKSHRAWPPHNRPPVKMLHFAGAMVVGQLRKPHLMRT